VRVYCEDTQLVIAVHDDGEGVDPSHWPFIFDAFYSANRSRDKKRSGYGLGLAIVKQIVTRHGGHVEIDHSDLGGACFRVILPIKT
jgi:two-component system sensor histidine kinase RstB